MVDKSNIAIIKKERNSSYELMRIISMILVVMCHVLVHGKIIENTSGLINIILTYIDMMCIIHVNSFILVSGYFQSESKFNIKKVWNILISSWFYRIIIIFLLVIFGVVSLSKTEILSNSLFLINNNYWFIGSYLIIYILSPFINKFIKCLSKKQCIILIIMLFIITSIISNINIPNIFSLASNQILSFIFLYIVGAFFRKNENIVKNLFKNKAIGFISLISLAIFFLSVNFLLKEFALCINSSCGVSSVIARNILTISLNNTNPFAIVASIAYFMAFSFITFKSKFINKVASTTLDVYMIHDHEIERGVIYTLLGFEFFNYNSYSIILIVFCIVFAIFTFGTIMGNIKLFIFKIIGKLNVFKKLNVLFDKLNIYINNIFSE